MHASEISYMLITNSLPTLLSSSLTCFLLLPPPCAAAGERFPEVAAARHNLTLDTDLLQSQKLKQQCPTDLAAGCKPPGQLDTNLPKPAAATGPAGVQICESESALLCHVALLCLQQQQ